MHTFQEQLGTILVTFLSVVSAALSTYLVAKFNSATAQIKEQKAVIESLSNDGGDAKVDSRLRQWGLIPALTATSAAAITASEVQAKSLSNERLAP